MTNDNDEEQMMADQLDGARHAVKLLKEEKAHIQRAINESEIRVAELEQAALDYMQSNGLVSSEHFYLKKTEQVIVDDVDALPDYFVRFKREADKAKIKAERPDANWYSIQENTNIVRK